MKEPVFVGRSSVVTFQNSWNFGPLLMPFDRRASKSTHHDGTTNTAEVAPHVFPYGR
jgi:hypothetical protein